MLGRVLSVGVFGIEGYRVEVEFDVRQGLPAIVVVGPPGAGKTMLARRRAESVDSAEAGYYDAVSWIRGMAAHGKVMG